MRKLVLSCAALCLSICSWAQNTEILIRAPWAQPSQNGQASVFFYMTRAADTADRLLSASTPLAAEVAIYGMSPESNFTERMRLQGITVHERDTVLLRPGGFHLFLTGLNTPIREGQRIPLTLRFQNAGDIYVEVPVQTTPPPRPNLAQPQP